MNASISRGTLQSDLAALDDETVAFLADDWQLWARDDQLPPWAAQSGEPWRVWLILGGRGAGKTRAGAEWIRAKALGVQPLGARRAHRIALVGETIADVRRVMVDGISGLLSVHSAAERPVFEVSKLQLVWPNGTIAQIFSAENADGLRGPQFDAAWCDAFVGAVLERAGIASTKSLRARSYLEWGAPLGTPKLGSIAVFSRGNDRTLGHVGFVVGEAGANLLILGGNQSDAVSVALCPRARLLGLRWPEGRTQLAPQKHGSPQFVEALAHVLEMEGGWSNDPQDPGGATNFGITLAVFASWRGTRLTQQSQATLIKQLRAIAPETVRAIYEARYWTPSCAPELPAPLALMHFDAAVNHGVGTAMLFLQQAVGVEADGEMGPQTRGAIARADTLATLDAYADLRRARYRALPHFPRFGRGWLARVDATLARGRSLAELDPKTNPRETKGDTNMTDTSTTAAPEAKWWGRSLTIWGTLVTAASAILPMLAAAADINLPRAIIEQAGNELLTAVQAASVVIGTLLSIYGRFRASVPLERKTFAVKL